MTRDASTLETEDILTKDYIDMEMEIEQLEQMENNDGKINGQ